MVSSDKVIELLTEELSKLNEHPLDDYSGDTLSRVAVRLASYKAGLGRHLTAAKKAKWQAEKTLSMAKAREYDRLKQERNSTDAKELKILGVSDEYDAYIEAQELEDALSGLSYNVHDIIDAIKSRLINLQMEMRESHA